MGKDNLVVTNFLNFIGLQNQQYKIWDETLSFSGSLNPPVANTEHALFLQAFKGAEFIQELYRHCNGLTYANKNYEGELEFGFYFVPVESFHDEKVEMATWGFSWGVVSDIEGIMEEYGYSDSAKIVFNEKLDEVLNGEEGDFEEYGGFSSIIVFGGILYSPNKLFLVTRGKQEGSVMYFDHDGGEFYQLASSFSEFLEKNKIEEVLERFL